MTYIEHRKTSAQLEREASAGNVEALLTLAIAVEAGWRGLTADTARAIELERRAAEAGSARAARWLGDRYYRGNGVAKDTAQAMAWYRRAAERGDTDAMANLVPLVKSKDPAEAAEGRKWLALAASAGQPYAVNTLQQWDRPQAETTLAEFAKMSLEEIAALVATTGDEMSVTAENVEATLDDLDQLVASWVHCLRTRWPDVRASASVSGDDIDFPGPDFEEVLAPVVKSGDVVEVTIGANSRHLQLDLQCDDDVWSLQVTSFEPHPTGDEQRWLIAELEGAAEAVGLDVSF